MYIYLIRRFVCSIAEYLCELCRVLSSPQGESIHNQRVKILCDTTHQNAY